MPEETKLSRAALTKRTKVGVSLIASITALVHALFPWIAIDLTTAILIVVAVLPWLLSIVRSLELPGGFKIELQDVKDATDAVTSPAARVEGITEKLKGNVDRQDADRLAALDLLQYLSARDPNVALVALRIEIEKRLRQLAELNDIDARKKSASQLLVELQKREAIRPPEMASGLSELIALGNRAAHGVEVSVDAAAWLSDTAPFLLALLDALITGARRRDDRAG